MTPAQIRRVRRSFATVVLNLDDVSDAFCKHLQRLDPGRGPVFDGDPLMQRMKVGGALAGLVGSLGRLDRIRPALGKLGRQRAGQGVVQEPYAMIGEALIAALRDVLGDQCDAATQRAWLLAYGQVVEIMTEHAADERVSVQAA